MKKRIKRIKSLEKLLLEYKPEFRSEMLLKKRELIEYTKTKCGAATNHFLGLYNDYLEEVKNEYEI